LFESEINSFRYVLNLSLFPNSIIVLITGTAASRSSLKCGDQLTSVNTVSLCDTPLSDALKILQEVSLLN